MAADLYASGYFTPAELTGYIRTALFDLPINQLRFAQWLPQVTIDDTRYSYASGGMGLAEASVFRSFDSESPIGRREGLGKVMGELPPISEKLPVKEYDQLRLRQLGADEVRPFIARDAERLARNINARFELARADALYNASVTINENGVVQTITFPRSGSHVVAPAGALWSDHTTSVPIDDLITWVNTYEATNGVAPGVILMSKTVLFHLQQNAQLKGRAYPTAATADASLPLLNVSQTSDVLTGLGLPPIEIVDGQTKVNGVATRYAPVNKILMLPAAGSTTASEPTDLGATLYGTTLESLEPDYQGVGPGIVASSWKSRDPIHLWTHAAAIGLPVLTAPDLTLVATVTA